MQRLLELVGAGRIILAPTAEIAAAVLDRIEQRYLAQGREVWPTPQVRDFSGWARQQYESQCADLAQAPRLLEDIEERQLWREVIASSAIASEFSDAGGAARAARQAVRAMHDYGIAPAALHDYPGLESAALLQWIDSFDERCRQLNALSADCVPGLLQAPAQRPVPLDSPAWRPGTLQWLTDHADAPLAPMCTSSGAGSPSLRLYKDFAAEMAACADWARESRAQNPAFRAWVHVPTLGSMRSTVRNAFDAALAPHRFSMFDYADAPAFAIAGGTPLSDFEPVRIALACLGALVEPLRFDQFSALLRAPALQAQDADAAAAARVDRALREQGPSEASLSQWIDVTQRVASALNMDALQSLLRLRALQPLGAVASPQLLSQWATAWTQTLESGPWQHRARWSSGAYQAAERFRELLGTMARADTTFGPLRLAAAVRALNTATRETSFQPQTGVTPVWITGQAVDPWLSFDGIWVAGAAAHTWPPPPSPMPLLPVQLQRAHAVPGSSVMLQLQRAMELQSRWLRRAPAAIFSCSSELDTPGLPSPLLTSIVAPQTVRESGSDPLWRTLDREVASLERFVDDSGPPFTPDESTRGSRSLREQSRCPFRGFADTRLRADPLEFPQPGFNHLERGIILHEALQTIWSRLRTSSELAMIEAAALQELIRGAVHGAVAVAMQRRDPGAHWSLREARRLQRLLPEWLDVERAREPFEVQQMEAAFHYHCADLRFNLRVDRIDRLADGALVLLDYKSGEVSRDWADERPENPQLPLYALSVGEAVTAVAYARVSARECRFVGVAEREQILPKVDTRYLEGGSGMSGQLTLWSHRLAPIAAELARGAARVAPTHNACRSCAQQSFCRIAEQPALQTVGDDADGEPVDG